MAIRDIQTVELADDSIELTNMIRGIAMIGIVIHHWFLYLPHQNVFPIISPCADIISKIAGSYVQIFFLLSGYGLCMSYYKKGIISWNDWFKKRFVKIIIPYWIIITLTYVVINLLKETLPKNLSNGFTLMDLSAYILLFRNLYAPSWGLNYTFWFMPVLIGLYIIYPFLITTIKGIGIAKFIIVISMLQYGAIIIFLSMGFPIGHQNDWFLFYVLIFGAGIALAHVTYMRKYKINRLGSYKMLSIGCTFYLISFGMKKYFKFGLYYNDIFTAIGLLLITLFICKMIKNINHNKKYYGFVIEFGKNSYFIYLIHYVLIMLLYIFISNISLKYITDSFVMLFIGGAFLFILHITARFISTPLNKLSENVGKYIFFISKN